MKDSLAILVSDEKFMHHVISLTTAACQRGKRVYVLFTGRGVKLTGEPGFRFLEEKAQISICEASFREHGPADSWEKLHDAVSVYFVNQTQHAELLEQVDRYIVF